METVSTFDAKNRLSALLQRVERGEEIAITRRGRVIARLVPPVGADRRTVQAAIRDLRRLARELGLEGLDWAAWKAMRDEGRR